VANRDDSEHPDVVKGVPVIFRDTEFTARLVVVDLLVRKADLGKHSTEIGIRIAEGAHEFYHLTVIQTEACEVLEGLDAGEPFGYAVVLLAQKEHERVLFAGALDAEHHVLTRFPLLDEGGYQVGGILEVSDDADDGVATGLKEGVDRGANVSKVACVDDDLNVGVCCSQTTKNRDRLVQGAVVNEDVLIRVAADGRHDLPHLAMELLHVVLFVVAGGDNADRLQRNLASGGELDAIKDDRAPWEPS